MSIQKCQVKAQIKALFVKADFNYDSEEESKFEQHENETLSIKVKFLVFSIRIDTCSFKCRNFALEIKVTAFNCPLTMN